MATEVGALFQKFQDHQALLKALAQSKNPEDRENFIKIIAPETQQIISVFANALSKTAALNADHLEAPKSRLARLAHHATVETARSIYNVARYGRAIGLILQTLVFPVAAWVYLRLSISEVAHAIPSILVSDFTIATVTTVVMHATRWSVPAEKTPGFCHGALLRLKWLTGLWR